MGKNNIFTKIVYIILVLLFGFILGNYLTKSNFLTFENMRTLPRPVINPPVKEEPKENKSAPFRPGETMNQMIDRYKDKYFEKDGIPLESTIQLYVNYCVNQGNVTDENKRKLTDIGYYLLNIFIPNLPTSQNPEPKENWPPIQWSNHSIFNVLIAPTPTYKVIRGQRYMDSYMSAYSASSSGGGGNIFGFLNDFGGSGNQGDFNSGDDSTGQGQANTDECDDEPEGKCGIGCPSSCLSGAFAPYLDQQDEDGSDSSKKDGNDGANKYSDSDYYNRYTNSNNNSNSGNRIPLPGGANMLVIGSANIDGYVITDEKQTSDASTLNDQINEMIDTYFISSGPNQNRPTQKMIDLFNQMKEKQAMDEIHMNKMRDMVYYILQVIIPGLPTSKLPRSYVEWRPIVWISRSEKKFT